MATLTLYLDIYLIVLFVCSTVFGIILVICRPDGIYFLLHFTLSAFGFVRVVTISVR